MGEREEKELGKLGEEREGAQRGSSGGIRPETLHVTRQTTGSLRRLEDYITAAPPKNPAPSSTSLEDNMTSITTPLFLFYSYTHANPGCVTPHREKGTDNHLHGKHTPF